MAANAHSLQETGGLCCPAGRQPALPFSWPLSQRVLHRRQVHPAFHLRAPSSGRPDPMRSPSCVKLFTKAPTPTTSGKPHGPGKRGPGVGGREHTASHTLPSAPGLTPAPPSTEPGKQRCPLTRVGFSSGTPCSVLKTGRASPAPRWERGGSESHQSAPGPLVSQGPPASLHHRLRADTTLQAPMRRDPSVLLMGTPLLGETGCVLPPLY